MLVNDFYNPKIFPISEDITIKEALEIFNAKHFNGVVVVNAKGELAGVLSLQDIARAIVPESMQEHTELANALYKPNFFHEMCQEMKNKKVKTIMRQHVITVTPEASIMEIAAEFLKNDLYIIPVCKDNTPIGIVTRTEIKEALKKGMGITS